MDRQIVDCGCVLRIVKQLQWPPLDWTTCFWECTDRTLRILHHLGQPKVLFLSTESILYKARGPKGFTKIEKGENIFKAKHQHLKAIKVVWWRAEIEWSLLKKRRARPLLTTTSHSRTAFLQKRRWTYTKQGVRQLIDWKKQLAEGVEVWRRYPERKKWKTACLL